MGGVGVWPCGRVLGCGEGLSALEASPDALQRVCFPHFGVPGLEPAGEGWRLCALLDGDDRSAVPAGRIRVHILFG